jgi:hypothetical protein
VLKFVDVAIVLYRYGNFNLYRSLGYLYPANAAPTTVLGVLGLFRQLLPHSRHLPPLDESGGGDGGGGSPLLGLYQLCAERYVRQPDHNIVNASLETLQSLLRHAPPLLAYALCAPGGVAQSCLPQQQEAEGEGAEPDLMPGQPAVTLPTGKKVCNHDNTSTWVQLVISVRDSGLNEAPSIGEVRPF